MGMTVKIDINHDLPVQLVTARRRGMLEAGEFVLALAVEGAPREDGEPRHEVHGADTGFVRVEPQNERVAIGFDAYWMLWQHEDLNYKHPHGHAKFLELALLENGEDALALVADAIREAVQ